MNFADWCSMISKQTAVICMKSEPEIKFQYSGHLGKYKCISSKKTNACNAKFVDLWANGNWGKSKSLLSKVPYLESPTLNCLFTMHLLWAYAAD